MSTTLRRWIFLHAPLSNLRTTILRPRRTQIRERRKRQIFRNLPLTENPTERRLHISRHLIGIRLPGNRNLEPLLNQPVNPLQRLIKTSLTAILVVTGTIRKIQAHSEMNRVGVIQQRQYLMPALE